MSHTSKLVFVLSVVSLSIATLMPVSGRSASPPLPRSTPEAQAVSSAKLLAFIDALDRNVDAVHSVMVLRHGRVIAEGWWAPYDAQTPHPVFSLTKSFTSTAVGLAIAEGKLSLDDTVLSFFPDVAPAEPSAELRALRVRDLLTLSTGHDPVPVFTNAEPWTKTFLATPLPYPPGTHFRYNTPASHMLSAIVQKEMGRTLRTYLGSRLFDVIGIADPEWETSPEGVSVGGTGLSLRTEDIARFGQLYLRKGEWNGVRVLPASWVEMATARQVASRPPWPGPDDDWEHGYGFQFWNWRNGSYRADGALGQYCIVLPEFDAVVAITGAMANASRARGALHVVWDTLLPAFAKERLPADGPSHAKLTDRLASLRLATVRGARVSPQAAWALGQLFRFDVNDAVLESIALEVGSAGDTTIVARVGGADYRLTAGYGQWTRGRFAFATLADQPVAVSAAWTADDTYAAIVQFTETPYALTLTMRFANGQVSIDSTFSPARRGSLAGPTMPTLTGVREGD